MLPHQFLRRIASTAVFILLPVWAKCPVAPSPLEFSDPNLEVPWSNTSSARTTDKHEPQDSMTRKDKFKELSRYPNIVLMLADDMGFGEVGCFNPKCGKIPTPHLDAMASNGMVFTDAHAGSSVCTPSRYGLLTGRYAWRSRLQKGVIDNLGDPGLITEERLTVADLLKSKGYHTAMFGMLIFYIIVLFTALLFITCPPDVALLLFYIWSVVHFLRQVAPWYDVRRRKWRGPKCH